MDRNEQHDSTSGDPRPRGAGAYHLCRLGDLDDFQVADGYPDIEGWDVKTSDGTKIGDVDDLIVDTRAMRVRYLDVKLDRDFRDRLQGGMLGGGASTAADAADVGSLDAATAQLKEGHTLLPVGSVQLNDDQDDIVIQNLTAAEIGAFPHYTGGELDAEYEGSLRSRFLGGATTSGREAGGTADRGDADPFDYDSDYYDDQRLFASRGPRRDVADGEQRLTLSEEELEIEQRRVQAGEVNVHKRVETEHVRQSVPLLHEEVEVERRPLSADAPLDAAHARIGADEIRVPVMREEAVVTKRLVPREEIIIRKRAVTEQRTVEADLRRERVTVDRDVERDVRGVAADRGGARTRGEHRSLGDRLADAVDDVSDRMDADPASRPGPDATDRRP